MWTPRLLHHLRISFLFMRFQAGIGLYENIHHGRGTQGNIPYICGVMESFLGGAEQGRKVIANGVVLVHGELGTGKTTLCQATANGVAVRTITRGVFICMHMEQIKSNRPGHRAQKVAHLFEDVRRLGNHSGIVSFLLD